MNPGGELKFVDLQPYWLVGLPFRFGEQDIEVSGVTIGWHVGQNATGTPAREGSEHRRILKFIITKFVSRDFVLKIKFFLS